MHFMVSDRGNLGDGNSVETWYTRKTFTFKSVTSLLRVSPCGVSSLLLVHKTSGRGLMILGRATVCIMKLSLTWVLVHNAY